MTLSGLFANFAVSLTKIEIDNFYQDSAIDDVQKTQITAAQVNLIKENTERDIRLQFEKIVKGESTGGASFTERYEALRKNLGGALKERLLNITDKEKADREVRAEHSLTARDLLAVVESSIGDRFDERVLFALNERRVNRLEKRNEQKEALQDLTVQLKIFGVVQSKIHSTQSVDGVYKPGDPESNFKASDFNYSNQTDFEASPEYKYLTDNKITNHRDFLQKQGITIGDGASYQDEEKSKKLSNFSSSVSAKSKLLNDEVQIKTTELNDTSSQYNSTVEAMNKFVQKYHSILQEILRAI